MNRLDAFNERVALILTRGVGSMWCAYAFAALTLTSLPANLDSIPHFVQWLSTSFLQLVLLSIILVGQDLMGRQAAIQATETHDAVMTEVVLVRDLVTELHARPASEAEGTAVPRI